MLVCVYIYLYNIHTIYVYIALILPTPNGPLKGVRVSISSLLSRLGGHSFQVCQPNPCKLLPGTPLGPSNHAEPRVLVASCMPEPRCWRWSDSLWNENSIGKILPPTKMCKFRKSMLLAMPILHPMQKEQQRCSTKKISSQWNFRPP